MLKTEYNGKTTDSTKRELFVVIQKNPDTFRIMKIYTRHSAAIDLCRINDSLQILDYSCLRIKQEYFKVYIVSVGQGKSYRIVKIEIDKKKAIKIAISINGLISTHQVGPNSILPQSVKYYQFQVNLDLETDDRSRVIYTDYLYRERFLELGKTENPTITHRRAYDLELPNRLEIRSTDTNQAEEIARQFRTFSRKKAIKMFEYNVDYGLEMIDEQWQIVTGEPV